MPVQSDAVFAALAEDHPQLAELAACVRYLGNLVLVLGSGRLTVPMCVFVDATGSILVHATHSKAPARVSISVESYSADCENWVTKVSEDADTRPPFVHVNFMPVGTPVAEMLTSHQAFAPIDNPARLSTFESLEDVASMSTRAHNRYREWRATLPRDELLQIDLKLLLGANYGRWGRGWTRRLQKLAIPQATLRR